MTCNIIYSPIFTCYYDFDFFSIEVSKNRPFLFLNKMKIIFYKSNLNSARSFVDHGQK